MQTPTIGPLRFPSALLGFVSGLLVESRRTPSDPSPPETDSAGYYIDGRRRVRIERDDGTVVATGLEFPSGTIAVEWRREAFPPGERTLHSVRSFYHSVSDAEQASDGQLVYEGLVLRDE